MQVNRIYVVGMVIIGIVAGLLSYSKPAGPTRNASADPVLERESTGDVPSARSQAPS